MKYLVFFAVFILGVPVMAYAGLLFRRVRSWLLTLLIASTALGDIANINFVSMELYRGPDRGFEVALTDLLAWALGIALVLRFPTRIRWVPYNTLVMLTFFGMSLVSSAVAPVPIYAAFSLFKLARMFVLYWVVANALRTDVDLEAVWRGIVLTGLVASSIALKQKFMGGVYRVPGPFDHPNTLSMFLNAMSPPLLLWGLTDRDLSRRKLVITLGTVVIMMFTVYATFSRAGIALSAATAAVAIVIANMRSRTLRVNLASAAVVLLVVAAGIKVMPHVVARFRGAPEESQIAREEFNAAAALMTQDHVLGVGLNNFSEVLTVTPKYRSVIRVMKYEEQAGVCHHIYWLTAAEMGFAGLVIFLVIILRFLWIAARGGWRVRGPPGMLIWGLGLGALALHLNGFLEWSLRITPVMSMYVVTSGIIVGMADVAIGRRRPAPPAATTRGPRA